MHISRLTPYALTGCVSAALLAGCGGSQSMNVVPGVATAALKHHRTFYSTGSEQFFKVPIGIKWIAVDARGAAGERKARGRGGRVTADVPVVEGERLAIFVGGAATRVNGGYNGGGSAGYSGDGKSFGGGGATDVRERGDHLQDRIIVAGGGGGQGEYRILGGNGGGRTADPGHAGGGNGGGGGLGGDQRRGGSGGSPGGASSYAYGEPGAKGSLGKGGSGGAGAMGAHCPSGAAGFGGGGGGGYYGGGGGGGGGCTYDGWTDGGGGGGGSSFIEPRARKSASWKGWKNVTRNGLVIFSW